MSNPTDFWINCLPIATHAIEIPSKVNQLMAAWWLSQPPWKIWSNKGHPITMVEQCWTVEHNKYMAKTPAIQRILLAPRHLSMALGTEVSLPVHLEVSLTGPQHVEELHFLHSVRAQWPIELHPGLWRVAQALIETINQGAVLQLARLHDRCVWMEVIELCIGRDIHCMEPHLERLEEWTQVVGTVLVRLHEQDFLIKRIQPREGYVQAAATRQDLVNVFLKPFWEARFGKVQPVQLCIQIIQICHKERDVKPACRVRSSHEGLLHHLLWNITGLIADPSCPGPNLLLQMLNFLPELGVGQPQGHKMRGTCSSCS